MNIEESLTEEQVYNFIRDNKPNGMQLIEWADRCGLSAESLSNFVKGLLEKGRLKPIVYDDGYALSHEAIEE